MIEQKCEYCGKEFKTYKSNNRKYCSKKCSAKKMWKKREKAKKVEIICLYCGKKFQLNASETRVKLKIVHYCSSKCRDNARKKGIIKKCINCGKEFYTTRNECCSKKCVYEYKKKNYKHKIYLENGYEVRYIGGYNKKGNVKNHRYIMERYLGRKLNENEIIHHKDGNKLNNDINNLEVMTRSEHSKLHRLKELNDGKKLFGRD